MPARSDLAKIHIAKQELGLDDRAYRAILRARYGRDSAADLTPREAADLLARFRAKGWRPASAAQRGLIQILWRRLEKAGLLRHGDQEALNAFIAHYAGRDDLRQLTVHEASRVIEMLKNWLARAGGQDRRH